MGRLDLLLSCALDGYKPHRRPSDCLADCCGIIAVIFLILAICLNQVRAHEPYGVPELLELARPVVSTGAGLHPDQTWFESRQKLQHLLAAELFAQYYCTSAVDPVKVENILGQINAERCHLHGRTLLAFYLLTVEMYHLDPLIEAVRNRGWVHPITKGQCW